MTKQFQLNVKLISLSAIVSHLYYGINIYNWWTIRNEKNLEKGIYLYPICIG